MPLSVWSRLAAVLCSPPPLPGTWMMQRTQIQIGQFHPLPAFCQYFCFYSSSSLMRNCWTMKLSIPTPDAEWLFEITDRQGERCCRSWLGMHIRVSRPAMWTRYHPSPDVFISNLSLWSLSAVIAGKFVSLNSASCVNRLWLLGSDQLDSWATPSPIFKTITVYGPQNGYGTAIMVRSKSDRT